MQRSAIRHLMVTSFIKLLSPVVLAMASGSSLDDLIFVGMVGIIDPERPNVEKAILQLRTGGVLVKMITGDAEKTAKAIGKFNNLVLMKFISLPSYFSAAFEDLHHHRSGHLWRRSRSHERRGSRQCHRQSNDLLSRQSKAQAHHRQSNDQRVSLVMELVRFVLCRLYKHRDISLV